MCWPSVGGARRTEVGVPYGMKGRTFYYDWMMVYGGIFPTLPDPEHGKTWLKPWDFKVVKERDVWRFSQADIVSLAASSTRKKYLRKHRSNHGENSR